MNLSIAPTIIGIILFGVGMFFFLRYFFKLNSVVYKPVGVFLIILVGVQMMFSELRFGNDPESNTIVGKGPAIAPTVASDTYNVFFGVGENDFTGLPVGMEILLLRLIRCLRKAIFISREMLRFVF